MEEKKLKAVKIVITFDDGSRDVAEGDVAERILSWYNSGQTMNYIHGVEYKGPQFTHIEPNQEVPFAPV